MVCKFKALFFTFLFTTRYAQISITQFSTIALHSQSTNMFKSLTSILLLNVLFSLNLHSQVLPPKISVGLLSSDIHESEIDRARERRTSTNNNTAKIGFYATVSSGVQVYKWLNLELGVTYQERLPLEKFTFGLQSSGSGVTQPFSLVAYPTSPQSQGWDRNAYLRFPNFRYAHLELIPMVSLAKQRFKMDMGIGVFYGYLLNHQTLQFTKEDFPAHAFLFEPGAPLANATGVDSYNAHDVGWIPKVAITYQLNNKCALGLSAKSYISQYALKELEVHGAVATKWNRQFNTNWVVYAAGIDFTYDIHHARYKK